MLINKYMQIIIRYKKEKRGVFLYEYYFYPFRMFEMTPPNWEHMQRLVKFGIRWGTIVCTKTQIDN